MRILCLFSRIELPYYWYCWRPEKESLDSLKLVLGFIAGCLSTLCKATVFARSLRSILVGMLNESSRLMSNPLCSWFVTASTSSVSV